MNLDLFKFVYLSHKGRISRATYWIYSLPFALIYFPFVYYEERINDFLFFFVMILIIYMGTMINIKRCHDRGRNGFFSLILLIPIVSLWPLIELGFLRGDEGINEYGPNPLNKTENA